MRDGWSLLLREVVPFGAIISAAPHMQTLREATEEGCRCGCGRCCGGADYLCVTPFAALVCGGRRAQL